MAQGLKGIKAKKGLRTDHKEELTQRTTESPSLKVSLNLNLNLNLNLCHQALPAEVIL